MFSFSSCTIYHDVAHNSILHVAFQPVPVPHADVFSAYYFLEVSVFNMYHSHMGNSEVV